PITYPVAKYRIRNKTLLHYTSRARSCFATSTGYANRWGKNIPPGLFCADRPGLVPARFAVKAS
ncbi:MAG: hypothetical protein R6U27_10495, partial [Desulfobacterales bacterium]